MNVILHAFGSRPYLGIEIDHIYSILDETKICSSLTTFIDEELWFLNLVKSLNIERRAAQIRFDVLGIETYLKQRKNTL